MSDTVHVYIEDHGPLGPAAYPLRLMPPPPLLDGGRVEVPRAQADHWAQAEAAWEQAQREMRSLLGAQRYRVLAALAEAAGAEAANRAGPRRGRPATGMRQL